LFKLFKIFGLDNFFRVFLSHQTSDKRLLRMSGEGIRFLTEFEPGSSGSSDLHSERVGAGTESLLSKFFDLKIYRQKFILKLIQKSVRFEGTPVFENFMRWMIILG
jgi:hypothetical protein